MFPVDRRESLLGGLLAAGLLVTTLPATAGDIIFSDSFETGDASLWSSTTGLVESCGSGPQLGSVLAGELGSAPPGSFDELACLEIRNDLPRERTEMASNGVALPASLGLTGTNTLALIGPGDTRIAAQFHVLSRWGGAPDDTFLPIRWLQVTAPVRVGPNATSTVSLRRYDALPNTADPFAVTVTPQGQDWVVDTGLATFTLDSNNPALFDSIAMDLDNDGVGRTTVYTHTPGAGPRLEFGGAVLDTAEAGEVVVDAFTVVSEGPVASTVALEGRFVGAGGSTICTVFGGSYERFGFTLEATFRRGSRDIDWRFHLRNACSDGSGGSWTDEAVTIDGASWRWPFSLGTPTSHFAGSGAIANSTEGFTGSTMVEQRKGGGNPWQRRARVLLGGVEQESGTSFDEPFLAVSDDDIVVAGHLGWMRYREPQALEIDDRTLVVHVISEPLVVGEGKAIWNTGRLSLRPAEADINLARNPSFQPPAPDQLQILREEAAAALERRLLLRAPAETFNAARLFASLGTETGGSVHGAYLTEMQDLHDDTVLPGGQWDRAKAFGSQLWPEVQLDGAAITNATPFDHNAAMNYWNPSGAELLEFLRSGDPQWVWDFAMPQSWLQIYTAYLNVGNETHSNRNGLAVNSGGTGEGQWHRSAFGSDDYTYDMGQQLAYALHPTFTHRERFRQAGRSVVDRYSIPQSQQGMREQFVNQVNLTRQVVQHFEMLANCAEFVPDSDGDDCRTRLDEIMAELADDNLQAGVMCQTDIPSATFCPQPQQFMQNAHMYYLLHRYLLGWGDPDGNLTRGLVEGPLNHYTFGLPKLGNGVSVDVAGDWASRLECDLGSGGTTVTSCTPAPDSDNNTAMYQPNKPHTAALLLMAHDLDPSIGMCQIVREAYDAMSLNTLWGEFNGDNAGWWKGAAQMMQGMVFGAGLYETCTEP